MDAMSITNGLMKDQKDGNTSLSMLFDILNAYDQYKNMSLTQYLRKSIIASRIFIQNRVAGDPCMEDLLITLQNIYCSFIMQASQLGAFVDNNRTVKNLMETVGTEKYLSFEQLVDINLPITSPTIQPIMAMPEAASVQSADLNKNYSGLSFSSGRIIEVKFGNLGSDGKGSFTINMHVQMMPIIIPNEVAEQFIANNFTPSFVQRYLQYSVGEIKFIRDVVLQQDLIDKRRKAIMNDTTGVLREMESRKSNAISNFFKQLRSNNKRHNIANTVLIYDKSAFAHYASKNGLRWDNVDTRQQFFEKTASVMVALVDPSYGMVEIYFNGISGKGEYTIKQLKASSKNDKYDLKDIINSFGNNNIPRI